MASKTQRAAILVFVVLAVSASGYAYYRLSQNHNAAPGELLLYGNVDIREVDLGFNSAGRVETMLADEGDEVHNGELLATIDATRYQAVADADQAQVAVQQAALNRLLAGSRSEEIRQARANVAALTAQLEVAKQHLARTEKLATKDFAAQQQRDDDVGRVADLAAQLDAASQVLSLAIKGPREEDIVQARASVKAAQAEFANALAALRDTRLYALADGIVTVRIVEPGTIVQAQTPIYTISLTDPMWVRTYVSEPDLGRVRPGMKAEIFTDSAPTQAHQGWVGFISPVAEFTPKTVETQEVRTSLVYRLRVFVKNPGNSLRQGMPVTVRLKLEATPDQPNTAASQ